MSERQFSDLTYLADFAGSDPDLITYHELRIRGFTTEDRVSPERESLLLEYDHEQLIADIMLVYGIGRAQATTAEQLAISSIYDQMKSMERFLYGNEA